MKIRKRYSFLIITFFVSLVTCITLVFSVNLILKDNVYSEVKDTLNDYISFFNYLNIETSDDVLLGDSMSDITSISSNENITVNILYLNEPLSTINNKTQKELVNYINDDVFDSNIIYNTTINGDLVYFTIINESETYLIYVNTSEYLYVLEILNQILFIVSIFTLSMSIIFGYRLGSHFENSENRLKRFFNNISHELKTPLTSIHGYGESIFFDISPNIKQSSKIIMEQCELMEKQIEELLLLSKIDSGAIKIQREEFNIYDTLDRLIFYTEPLASNKGVRLIRDFDSYEANYIGDEKYIYNALNSILSNSIKYAEKRIVIKAQKTRNQILITIQDDGKGINENDLPQIFERFYIGEDGGTGIGLSIAEEILKLHRGKVSARNNNGAVFEIILNI